MISALFLALGSIVGYSRQTFVPLVAILLFVIGGLLFPKTYEFVPQIRSLSGASVRVYAWGLQLDAFGTTSFRLRRTFAFGAGLHIYLSTIPTGQELHIKIAQPRDLVINTEGFQISDAKYIQCQGKTIDRIRDQKALLVRVLMVGQIPRSSGSVG